MNGCEEVSRGLVVAGGDGAKEFELGEEVFNQVASFVKFFVVCAVLFAVGFGRNHRRFTRFRKRYQHPLIGIEAFVGEQYLSFQLRQQRVGSFQIAGLTAGEMKSDRVTQSIDGGVNLGAQASLAAPDGLFRAPFFSAPALC